MNEFFHRDSVSDVPWPTSDDRVRVPDTSMLPGSEKAAPAAVGMLRTAVKGAHDTIDRLANGAEPAVQKLGDTASAAADALHAKADQLRETRDEWVEATRTTIRSNPLAAVAAALVLGVLIARIARVGR